jgi:uncharacterized protein
VNEPLQRLVALSAELNDDELGAILTPWRQVAQKADAFFDQVQAVCASSMRCRAGCTECCQQDLNVLFAEGVAIVRGWSNLPRETRAALISSAGRPAPARGEACALLDAAGRCSVYAWRPLICRTHGLPLRRSGPGWSSCRLNFTPDEPQPPAECILNEGLLTAGLTVADGLIRERLGGEPSGRLSIRALLLVLA